MMMVVVSIRDKKTEVFSRPMFVRTPGEAIRSFSDEVNRHADDNPLSAHPEDYELYTLGSFDDSVGKLHSLDFPEFLVAADSLKR